MKGSEFVCYVYVQHVATEELSTLEPVTADLSPDVFIQVDNQLLLHLVRSTSAKSKF